MERSIAAGDIAGVFLTKVLKNGTKTIRLRKAGILTDVEGLNAKVAAGHNGYQNPWPFSRQGK